MPIFRSCHTTSLVVLGTYDMTLHLEGVHICHIIKNGFEDRIVIQFQPKNEMKILVKMVYPERICMVKADTHVVWDQFNTEDPMGLAFCARGCITIQSCEVEIRGGWPLLMCNLLFWYPCLGASQRHDDDLAVLNYHLNRLTWSQPLYR